MPIVLSRVVQDLVQKDGRRFIQEEHVDHTNTIHQRVYLAEANQDVEAELPVSAAAINDQLRQAERLRLIQWVEAGNSLFHFMFVDLTAQEGARHLLRYFAAQTDFTTARGFAQRVAAATLQQIETMLGVTPESAGKVKAWAQGVLTALAQQDAALANASDPLSEVG
jgi:hypothetical protein